MEQRGATMRPAAALLAECNEAIWQSEYGRAYELAQSAYRSARADIIGHRRNPLIAVQAAKLGCVLAARCGLPPASSHAWVLDGLESLGYPNLAYLSEETNVYRAGCLALCVHAKQRPLSNEHFNLLRAWKGAVQDYDDYLSGKSDIPPHR